MSGETKKCRDCGTDKPLEEYHRSAKAKDGRQSRCKPCAIALVIQWQRDNPHRLRAKQRRSDLKRWYGMTEQEHADLLASQGGTCAICGAAEDADTRLVVDHCHASGIVRGLLCSLCNTALGSFKDDIARLRRAAAYLQDRQ